MVNPRRYRIFACSTLLPSESEHHLVEGGTLVGEAITAPIYHLVEVNARGALVAGGDTAVKGRIYELDAPSLAAIDVARDHPRLFERRTVELEGQGEKTYAYFLRPEQCRGKRRIRSGDWLTRFSAERPEPGAWVQWAKNRHRR